MLAELGAQSRWFKGPAFLHCLPEQWPETPLATHLDSEELKKVSQPSTLVAEHLMPTHSHPLCTGQLSPSHLPVTTGRVRITFSSRHNKIASSQTLPTSNLISHSLRADVCLQLLNLTLQLN